MSSLADVALSLIRTRAELFYREANAHGQQMHQGVDILEEAHATGSPDPVEVHRVTHKALASAITVIARADDSSGIIGDACRRLLELHPKTAAAAKVSAGPLVEWMMTFQFAGKVDFFELDPVAYAPALGQSGLEMYRAKLDETADRLELDPRAERDIGLSWSHEHFVLQWNAQRLAVHDRDIEMIIRTHARDKRVAAWLQDTAEALEEIGEHDLAIDWARNAAEHDSGHQSARAAEYWCQLLQTHAPEKLLPARTWIFNRWPNSSTAARLHHASGQAWPEHRDEVMARLKDRPRDAVLFVHGTLNDVAEAWQLAHELELADAHVWELLVKDYQKVDPLAVLPVLRELVDGELAQTGAVHYKRAARHLKAMRKLTTDKPERSSVDGFIAELRESHRRRPRLQQEFTRAGLP